MDENGSYKGYGAACEEDVVEEADVYIRGRLTKFDNTGLHFDSDESEGTCGARWDHNSHDGSEQTGNRKQKRRRSTSFLSSGKRMKLLATEEMAMPNSSSISYLAASACISSVMLDGEDGYDGASELRSYDGDFIDDHTTDNEAIHHGESMRKMQASGSTMTTMFGGSPEQDSINQSRTTASFASSATTSIYSGSPEDGCQSDQAISSPKLGHNRYAKDKKRHLK